jgi:hypothetical protein
MDHDAANRAVRRAGHSTPNASVDARRLIWSLERHLLRKMEATPAKTVEGFMAKARCAQVWAVKRKKMESLDGGAETMALSIFSDLERLTQQA